MGVHAAILRVQNAQDRHKQFKSHGPHSKRLKAHTVYNYNLVWTRWKVYCATVGVEIEDALKDVHHVKAYFQTYQDQAVEAGGHAQTPKTMSNYFRRLRQAARQFANFTFADEDAKDISNYLRYWMEHRNHREKGHKGVLTGEDLMRMIHCHWARDATTYPSERQRVQLALVLLIFAYAGLRPMSVSKTLSDKYEEATAPTQTAKLCYSDFEVFKLKDDEGKAVLGACFHPKFFKGDFGNEQRKQFTWWQQCDVRWDPVLHLIALGVADSAFEGDLSVRDILGARIPPSQDRLTFYWKDEFCGERIFTMHDKQGKDKELTSGAISYRFARLSAQLGLKHGASAYSARRGIAKILTPIANERELLAIFGHTTFATNMHYQDCRSKFDTQGLLLHGEERDQHLTEKLNAISADADWRADQPWTTEDCEQVANLPEIREKDALVSEAWNRGDEHGWQEAKKALKAAKDRTKRRIQKKRRERYWKQRDLEAVKSQQHDNWTPPPVEPLPKVVLKIPERKHIADIDGNLDMRDPNTIKECIAAVEALAELCHRTEAKRNGKETAAASSLIQTPADESSAYKVLKYDPGQCFICICDDRRSLHDRLKHWSKQDKLWDHVHRQHSKLLEAKQPVYCMHPQCRGQMCADVQAYKSHVQLVHGIRLQKS